MLKEKHFMLVNAATGLFVVFTLFVAQLFSMITSTPGFTQAVDDGDNLYDLIQHASAQEESTPTLPFTPFSQQQEAEPEEQQGQQLTPTNQTINQTITTPTNQTITTPTNQTITTPTNQTINQTITTPTNQTITTPTNQTLQISEEDFEVESDMPPPVVNDTTFVPPPPINASSEAKKLSPPPPWQVLPSGAVDRGCRDGGLNLNRVNPAWVSVDPSDEPETSDEPEIAEGIVVRSLVNHEDFPFLHKSHDQNFDVILDPEYVGLLSTANNRIPVNGVLTPLMHMEWEIGTANDGRTDRFPKEFWPMEGDRVWMMGRWIYDCSHMPYKTEIHPISAVAFTRLEPTVLPGDTAPSLTTSTWIYIHGQGGYYNIPVTGEEYHEYEFDIYLPPKPSETAQLSTQVVGVDGADGVVPILTPNLTENKVNVLFPLADVPNSPDRKIRALITAGWREPVLSQGYRLLRVTFDSIQVLKDHDDHPLKVPSVISAEWNHLWAGVNGQWLELLGPSSSRLNPVNDLDPPSSFRNKSVVVFVPEKGTLNIQTTGWESDGMDVVMGQPPPSKPLHWTSPFLELWVGQLTAQYAQAADINDKIGIVEGWYTAANNFGIGAHKDYSAANGDDVSTYHDFILSYHIEEIGEWDPGFVQAAGVELISKNSGKCLHVAGASMDDQANVQQFRCNNGANQRWILQQIQPEGSTEDSEGLTERIEYAIINKKSGKCLDVAGASLEDGGNVQQYTCHYRNNQIWMLQHIAGQDYAIISKNSGKCLHVAGASMDDQANVQQFRCNNGVNQIWTQRSGSNPP